MITGIDELRAEIKGILEGVYGIGVVQDYRRHSVDWNEIAAMFKHDGIINGWVIEARSLKSVREQITSRILRTWGIRVSGIYSLVDAQATAKQFEALVERVVDALDADATLGGKVHKAGPCAVTEIAQGSFASALCHICAVDLEVVLRIAA
jgi:hypothetical protein